MSGRLLTGNIQNDEAALEEVRGLLADLRDTWNQIGDAPAQGAATLNAGQKQTPVLAAV
jgi:flagellin-specific chaperone FliS